MDIKNEMEGLVRAEVDRLKETCASGADVCWCALCETDIVALALTLLPPFYCRQDTYGYAAGLNTSGKIRDAVQSAIKRVSMRPKHRTSAPGAFRGEINLVNYTLEVGAEMVGPAMGRSDSGCGCTQCRSDALAYALNRYPAKYGVIWGGRRNLNPTYLDFMRFELGMLITQAARVVSAHPHH